MSIGDNDMATGKVKMFNEEKGFGFIIPDEGGKDVFMHFSRFADKSLKKMEKGERVSYELGEAQDGRTEAKQIKYLEESENE